MFQAEQSYIDAAEKLSDYCNKNIYLYFILIFGRFS